MTGANEVLINAGVFGVALPAVTAGAAALTSRLSPRVGATLTALGIAAGYLAAHWRLAGAPVWPPVDATQWLPIAAAIGALIGAVSGGLGHGDPLRERRVHTLTALVVLGASIWLLRGVLGTWLERWPTSQSYQEVGFLATLGTLAYIGLARLVAHDDRGRAFGALLAVGILIGGAAATLGLARSVLLAQLLGAVGAGVGGLALASLAGVPGSVLSFAAAPIALTLTVAVGAGQHYAELPRNASVALLVAPSFASFLFMLPKRAWQSAVLAVLAVGAAVGTAAFLTTRATGDAEAYAPPTGEVQVEMDYGYGPSTPDSATPAGPEGGTGASEPDPYGDMKAMENWKPGQQ